MPKSQVLRVKINKKGVEALLKSDEVAADLRRRVENMWDAIPKDDDAKYEESYWIGKDRTGGRAMASLKTTNAAARKANAENNTLIKSLDAGRA